MDYKEKAKRYDDLLAKLQKAKEDNNICDERYCLGYIPDEFLRRWLKDITHVKYDKPADKVEPKFKIEDWIVDKSGLAQQVLDFRGGIYTCTYNSFTTDCESNYRLWTIKDAKPGDVLSNGKMIVIFKHFEEPSYRQHIVAYIGLDRGGDIQITDDTWRLGIDKAKPATKEQRELLFQKMKENGYEWDDKEKKPIKSEASLPSFDEQQGSPIIDIPFGAKDSELQEAQYHIPEGFYVEIQGNKVIIKKGENPSWSKGDSFMTRTLIDVVKSRASIRQELRNEFVNWLESLKNRVFPQPKEWSETDEKCIRLCTDIINSTLRAGFCVQLDRDRCIDWLQSLKQRVIWKPSEIQLARLKEECDKYWEPDGLDTLYTLYQDLKKL